MSRINELRLIARVAQMYHGEGKRQAEIADHLHMSQATISRMLKRAEQEDIVRTTVIPPPGTFSDLEAAVRERFGISEAIVVDCTEDREGAIMARIGEGAAHFLEVTLKQGEIIGVSSWSGTVLRMVDNIHPLKGTKAKYVVQTLGGMGDPSVQAHATQLTTRLARLTGAGPRPPPRRAASRGSCPSKGSRPRGRPSSSWSAIPTCGRRLTSSAASALRSLGSARSHRPSSWPGRATSFRARNSPPLPMPARLATYPYGSSTCRGSR